MAKVTFKVNNFTNQIFTDLEKYLEFCKDYGYYFDERDLYKERSNAWRQYTKHLAGKPVKNMWEQDAVK
jgi:hypothetical protein